MHAVVTRLSFPSQESLGTRLLALFDILGAGDGARLAVASKNEVLEARKEAIQTCSNPGIDLALLRIIKLLAYTGLEIDKFRETLP